MPTPFLTFLQELRFETVHLSYQWQPLEPLERGQALAYLEEIYHQESLDFPHQAPPFDAEAAIWAAELLYHAAQAILNRKATLEELTPLFEGYGGEKTAGAILSVDLCLRFVPDLLEKLKLINPDDGLILLLELQLEQWPYSAVGYATQGLPQQELDNPCVCQLYVDRIIAHKDTSLLVVPALVQAVKASLGAYQQKIWPDLDFFVEKTSPLF